MKGRQKNKPESPRQRGGAHRSLEHPNPPHAEQSPRQVIFTIVSANYISYAATLMQSVRAHHPEAARVIVLADRLRAFPDLDLAADLLGCDDLEIPLLDNMKLWYSIMEFNTAIKPFAFAYLLDRGGFDHACYLDPDILLFRPIDEVFGALTLGHTMVVTPHMLRPLQDGYEPSDITIMKSGVYNLGFLAVRSSDDVRRFLQWWSDRCVLHCRVDIAGNMFTDQRWMDLAPAFVERILILRSTGYNVAYWNVMHRPLSCDEDGAWYAGNERLTFFHFSGIDIEDPGVFSRHQNRLGRDNLPESLAAMCGIYRELVRRNKWQDYRVLSYGFGSFADGRPIEDPMRHWLLRAVDEQRIVATDRLRVESDFFDFPDETAAARGVRMTRHMYQLWLDRDDLQAVFDIFTPEGVGSYLNWFASESGCTANIDPRSVAAARRVVSNGPLAPSAESGLPPWPSVAAEVWGGRAADAHWLLAGSIAFALAGEQLQLPMQAALEWELRPDLQHAFPMSGKEGCDGLVTWALTSGIEEGVVEAEYFSESFWASLSCLSPVAQSYRDVPITKLMFATRHVTAGRDHFGDWGMFPSDRRARLSHALWFAFAAPRLFKWPDSSVQDVRAWFGEPSDIVCGSVKLSRASAALWETRPELQDGFSPDTESGCWEYVFWLVTNGLQELGVSIASFDPGLHNALTAHRDEPLPLFLELVWRARADLQSAFRIDEEPGRAGLLSWGSNCFAGEYGGCPLGEAVTGATQSASAVLGPSYKTSLLLTGEWSAATGRGEDLRGSVRALLDRGFDDFIILERPGGALLDANGEILPSGTVQADVNVVHMNADSALSDWRYFRHNGIRAEKTVGFWAWELESLPRRWLHAFSFFDEIWASTQFAFQAFDREKIRPVRLMPMAVIPPAERRARSRVGLGLPEFATVFLFMFDFRSFASRKNPEGVVRAFRKAFSNGDESAYLLIKTQNGAAVPGELSSLAGLCDDPRIEIRDAKIDRQELLQLLDGVDAFVSLHRSEGFGRGPAEAMLLGKPVILTGYSGTEDFADPSCAYVVPYTLRGVAADEYPGAEGQRWAEPDINAAARHMQSVHAMPAEARAVGMRGQARIAELYNTERVGTEMLRALGLASRRSNAAP